MIRFDNWGSEVVKTVGTGWFWVTQWYRVQGGGKVNSGPGFI